MLRTTNNPRQRTQKILVIYGEGTTGIDNEHHYHDMGFTAIIHREAQFFDGPEKHVAAFAIESEHTSTILAIRDAYEESGLKAQEVSRNRDETERMRIPEDHGGYGRYEGAAKGEGAGGVAGDAGADGPSPSPETMGKVSTKAPAKKAAKRTR